MPQMSQVLRERAIGMLTAGMQSNLLPVKVHWNDSQSKSWLSTRELVLDQCTSSYVLWRHITHKTTMAAPADALLFMQVVHVRNRL